MRRYTWVMDMPWRKNQVNEDNVFKVVICRPVLEAGIRIEVLPRGYLFCVHIWFERIKKNRTFKKGKSTIVTNSNKVMQ